MALRRTIDREPLRYLAIGAVCAAVNNIVLIGGDWWGIGHFALIVATWVVGGTLGYGLHASFTFRTRLEGAAYLRFMAGVALGVPVAWAFLALFAGWLRWPMVWAAPAMTVAMIAYNYLNARTAILWRRLFNAAR